MTIKIISFFKLIKTIKNYRLYLKDYFGKIKNTYIIYKLRNGVKYKIRGGSTDRFIFNEVWLHKSYIPKGFEIKPNDIVVDIGAHAGIFTILASYYAQNGKIYSFEPFKENYDLLLENIKLNNFRNVHAFNKAVSNKSGKLKFYVSQTKNKGQNSMYKLDESQKEVSVDKISFKDFLKRIPKIDFLKIDCEGAEYEILFSLDKKDLEKINKISMEYHNYKGHNGEELANFLYKNGFKVKLVHDGEKFGWIYALNDGLNRAKNIKIKFIINELKKGRVKYVLFSIFTYPLSKSRLKEWRLKTKDKIRIKNLAQKIKKHYNLNFLNKYSKFYCDALKEIYEDKIYNFFQIKKGDVICDVGAGGGEYSILCAKNGAECLAFELRKEAYDLMNKNIKLNNFQNKIKTFLGKIDDKDNLDSYFKEYRVVPSILKIDIEGDEAKVLNGAVVLLKKHPPKIILETHSKDLKKECLDFLFKLNYAIKYKINMGEKTDLFFLEKNQK